MDMHLPVNILLYVITSLTSLKCVQTVDTQENYYHTHQSAIPKFLPVPNNITVHEGETAHLRCRIYNLGPKAVFWRKTTEDSPLTVERKLFSPKKNIEAETEELPDNEIRHDLIIKNVRQDQAGIYACQISATEMYSVNVTLNVLDPVEFKSELTLNGTSYVSLMEDIHLVCNATGAVKAPDGVDWFFNGDPVSASRPQWYGGRLQELNRKPLPGRSLISEIIIEKATMEDQGHYVCRLSKTFAQTLKVHVLNDKKNHKEPKRDMKDKTFESADKLKLNGDTLVSSTAKTDYSKSLFLLFVCLFLDWR